MRLRRLGDTGPARSPAKHSLPGRADLHIHTRYSDGVPSVRAVLQYVATRTPLDVVAITDHDTIEGALEAQVLGPSYGVGVIVGEEITSREGHILGLFLHDAVPPGLSGAETVAAIHAQGGLAIAAHPFLRGFSHLEGGVVARMGIGVALRRIPFDAVETCHGFPALAWANYRARRYNARYCGLPELGNSDAHVKEAIGTSFTHFAGRTAEDVALSLRQGLTMPGSTPHTLAEGRAYYRFWCQGHSDRRRKRHNGARGAVLPE